MRVWIFYSEEVNGINKKFHIFKMYRSPRLTTFGDMNIHDIQSENYSCFYLNKTTKINAN